MLRSLTDQEREEILSGPRKGETDEQWLAREDSEILAKYPTHAHTKPRPLNGHGHNECVSPREMLERSLSLPTPLKGRMILAMDLLEMFPPTAEELKAYREKYPTWPKNFPKIVIRVGDEEFVTPSEQSS
jgi:hypothetical protein